MGFRRRIFPAASTASGDIMKAAHVLISTGVLALAATLAVAPALPQTAQKKIQCWTDKEGKKMCGDRVPQEYAGQKREVIKDGRVVDTVKAAKTPEEIEADKRQQAAVEEAKRKELYDRQLLETY